MSTFTLDGPIEGKYGPFYVYKDANCMDKGVIISGKDVIDATATEIEKAVNNKAINKIGLRTPKADPTKTDFYLARIMIALETISKTLIHLVENK